MLNRASLLFSPRWWAPALAALALGLSCGPQWVWAQAPVMSSNGQYGGQGTYPGAPLQYGGPVVPVQNQRPAGWPGGPGATPTPPPRKSFAQPFTSADTAGISSAAGPQGTPAIPVGIPNSAAGRSPVVGSPPVVSKQNWTNDANTASRVRTPEWVANNTAAPRVTQEVTASPPAPPSSKKYEGAEILARVGGEVILMADVLYEVNRRIEGALSSQSAKQYTPEQIELGRQQLIQQVLKRTIETKLLVVEARRKIPPEQLPKIEKHFNDSFEKQYLKKFLELEKVRSRTELEAKLRRAGTTYDALRRQQFEGSLAQHWLEEHVRNDDEITLDEMLAYYHDHAAQYEKIPRARWEHVMVRFDKFGSKAEAYQAIAQRGNELIGGADFGEVAKAHSHDYSAADGGVHAWTSKGSLASDVLDQAIFSLPPDKLSQILEDNQGFHIVRVIERDDETRVAFPEAQAEIRTKIRESRNEDRRKEFLDKIREQTPVWTIYDEGGSSKYSAGDLNSG